MHTKKVSEPRTEKITQCDLLTNTAYMSVLTIELMLREIERQLEMNEAQMKREKKRKYSMFLDHCKKALFFAGELTEDIFEIDSKNKWKNIPVWQEESNELARLILLYADKSANVDNVNEVFKLLRSLPGEDIITEEMLDRFRLKTL